ncbi:hypothetical protein GCM10009753_54710 [Streptantibioticus ferralitis]
MPWGTSWLTVHGTVPQEWAGRTVEALLDLGFDENMPGFQCEGLVYRPDGSPVKGLNPRNQWVRIGSPVAVGEQVTLHVEAAANPVHDTALGARRGVTWGCGGFGAAPPPRPATARPGSPCPPGRRVPPRVPSRAGRGRRAG